MKFCVCICIIVHFSVVVIFTEGPVLNQKSFCNFVSFYFDLSVKIKIGSYMCTFVSLHFFLSLCILSKLQKDLNKTLLKPSVSRVDSDLHAHGFPSSKVTVTLELKCQNRVYSFMFNSYLLHSLMDFHLLDTNVHHH